MKSALAALTLSFCTILPLGALPAAAQAQTPAAASEPAQVSARGTARVYRKPDHLDVIVGVQTIASTAGEAYNQCATSMDAIIKALKGMSLEGVEFQTGVVDLSPRYENRRYDEPTPLRIVGYEANNTVRIRTKDLKAAPGIIDAALRNGANRVDGVTFGIKEVLEAREEALRLATRAAKRKAQVMADALDAKIGRIASITETTYQYTPWSNRSSNLAQVQVAAGEGAAAAGAESIEPGMIEIVVDVNLAFTIVENQ